MKYKGWNFEKTLLIRSDSPYERPDEFIDTYVAVETHCAQTLARDLRVVLKPAWNRLGQEVPCQVYNIQEHGSITTFRVAFTASLPPHATQRVGLLYDNPAAPKRDIETDLSVAGNGCGYTIENRHYCVSTDPRSGQLDRLTIKLPVLEYTHVKSLTPEGLLQGGVQVLMADKDAPTDLRLAHAGLWQNPATTCVQGPLFFSMIRRGRLAPAGREATEHSPTLEIAYKFFADKPYFLVSSRLEFHADTPVYGIHQDWITVNQNCFSHYCFRPVTPTLPASDLEEVGHILVASDYTQGLPEVLFGGFLPYDLAWHGFISTVRKRGFRFDYALSGIRLRNESSSPDQPAPHYRAATFVRQANGLLSWSRDPVYVKNRRLAENLVTIPKGTVYTQSNAIHMSEWDEKKQWLNRIEALGKRLNQPLTITQHPHFLAGSIPPEPPEWLPCGRFAHFYEKAGIR